MEKAGKTKWVEVFEGKGAGTGLLAKKRSPRSQKQTDISTENRWQVSEIYKRITQSDGHMGTNNPQRLQDKTNDRSTDADERICRDTSEIELAAGNGGTRDASDSSPNPLLPPFCESRIQRNPLSIPFWKP